MQTVAVQIPASLFVALFSAYQEDTGEVITGCLQEFMDKDRESESEVVAPTTPYPRPGPGTITGKVWEIADDIYQKTGSANRAAIVQECINQGINMNTANTQYSFWKKNAGL